MNKLLLLALCATVAVLVHADDTAQNTTNGESNIVGDSINELAELLAGKDTEAIAAALGDTARCNMENRIEYSVAQFELIGHALVIGYAAQAAGFIYFAFTMNMTPDEYKMSSVYGMIVMVSAFILLYNQWASWEDSFVFVPVDASQEDLYSEDLDESDLGVGIYKSKALYGYGGTLFSNGYRYLNWSIDVPLLLLQLVCVSGIQTESGMFDKNTQVSVTGLLMIYMGYIGQFFENEDEPAVLIVLGIIGCVFYLIMLILVIQCLAKAKDTHPDESGTILTIGLIFAVFWTIYPISYFMPVISFTAEGVVIRQFIYTIADVVSKVVYGVILTNLCLRISKKGNDAKA